MNGILGLVGTVCICGAFYLMAKKKADEVGALQNRVNKLESENHDFWTRDLKNKKVIRKLDYMIDIKEQIISNQKSVIETRGKEVKELGETILFDNDVMIQKTEMLEKANNRFAKDTIKIADLNNQLCNVNMEVVELKCDLELYRNIAMSRYDEIRYLRKKIKVVRANRLKRVIRAEKLGGVR